MYFLVNFNRLRDTVNYVDSGPILCETRWFMVLTAPAFHGILNVCSQTVICTGCVTPVLTNLANKWTNKAVSKRQGGEVNHSGTGVIS